jgi:hypothetical protein
MMQRTDPISGSTVDVPTYLIKVGDNQHQFKDLNWVAAPAADVYDWGKAKEIVLVDGKLKFKKADDTFVKTEDGTADYAVDLGLSNYVSNEDLLKITGDIVELNAAIRTTDSDGKDTTTLVSAINKTLEIANAGGAGAVVSVKKETTATDGSHATYKVYQGSGEDAVAVGDAIEIPVSTKVEDSEQNGYIKVDDQEVQVFDDIFKADGKTVVAAGGIAAGSTVNGKTFQQILYNMMFPYQKPTISVSASPKNGGTFEKGNTQTITSVTATVTKKTEEIAKVELYNGSTLVATKNGDDALSSTNSNLVKNGGAVVFEGLSREVSANGGQYKAKVYDTTGGTAEASTGSFTFVYPYYIGICYEGDTIDEALVLGLPSSGENGDTGSKKVQSEADVKDYEFSYTKGSMVFAFPKSYGKLSSIKDPSNFEIIGSFTIHEVNVTGLDGTAQPYYVYVSGVATNKDFKVDFFK